MEDSVRLVINGVSGRMGGVLTRLISESKDFTLAGGLVSESSQHKGVDIGLLAGMHEIGICASDDASIVGDANAIIDFSTPAATMRLLDEAQKKQVGMVIGTTGFTTEQENTIENSAHNSPIVQSANMSIPLAIMETLVRSTSALLSGDDWDIEILEKHHNNKQDAPSGTALQLGVAAASGRGMELNTPRYDRSGDRPTGEIGFASLRAGGAICQHTVLFANQNEEFTLGHYVGNREVFAQGALTAAKWIQNRPATKLYGMSDVLDLAYSKNSLIN